MRFMVMHKMTAELEKGLAPAPEIIAGVNALIGEALQDKIFVAGEGLRPTSERTRVTYEAGERKVTDGPFTEAKELVGGFALMRVRSKQEALDWCDRFAALTGDVELIMGPVVEAWDLGMMPKPKNPPLRMLSIMHQRTDDDRQPTAEEMTKMGALIEEMTNAGVMLATGGLTSTKHGARILFDGKKRTVIDGPFTESKELVAGYAILDLPSKAAAVDWALRFGEIVRVNEVEVRQMPEW